MTADLAGLFEAVWRKAYNYGYNQGIEHSENLLVDKGFELLDTCNFDVHDSELIRETFKQIRSGLRSYKKEENL